jgi:hypothetical protein
MITGFATGCPTDINEELLLEYLPVSEVGNNIRVILPITTAIGCGNEYWVFGADQSIQQIKWIAEGTSQNISVLLDPTLSNHSVFAEPNGTWSTVGSTNFFELSLILLLSNGKSVNGSFTASSEIISTYGDNGQLTSWSLVGLGRYSTLRPDSIRKTEAECDVTLATVSTTHTVTIYLNGQILAQGSRIGNGSITLAAMNNSGVSGTVSLTYSADILSGAYVTKRYADFYTITVGSLSTTVADNGLSEILSFTLGPLTTGSYTLTITPTSDTGITGTPLTQSITIAGAPLPPGVPIYVSGDITATIISYAASATAGATYNIYMPQEVGSPTFIESPAATHIAGTGTLATTLPARTAAAGDMTIFVTSVSGGIESPYQKVVITYLADGTIPNPAPNIPSVTFQTIPITGGTNLNVTYAYDKTGQLAAPVSIQTSILVYGGATTNQTATTIGAFVGNIARGSLTIAIPTVTSGFVLVRIRSTSAGGANSDWSNYIGPVWFSTEVIGAITGLTTNIVG